MSRSNFRSCRRCKVSKPLTDFPIYKRGEYLDQRRHVCQRCCNDDTLKWRARKGSKRREFVSNTPRLRAAIRYLQDYYGGVDRMCRSTGISKSLYQRVMRDLSPRLEKSVAAHILSEAAQVAEARVASRVISRHMK